MEMMPGVKEQVDRERELVLPPDFERWPPVCPAEELECEFNFIHGNEKVTDIQLLLGLEKKKNSYPHLIWSACWGTQRSQDRLLESVFF